MVTVVILAAGASRRFGPDDKLLAPLEGGPMLAKVLALGQHAPFDGCILVASRKEVADLAHTWGAEVVMVPEGSPQSVSLKAGIAAARHAGAAAVMILLGDMPYIQTQDLDRLLAHAPSHGDAACAFHAPSQTPMPPALLPAPLFDLIAALEGDRGAGAILRKLNAGAWLPIAPENLRDIDYLQDLPPAEGLFGRP